MRYAKRSGVGILASVVSALLAIAPAEADTTLKLIPGGDLKTVDPIWTTADITGIHAYNIYDVLFAQDSRFAPKPEMVESWNKSADGLTWSFKLRPGLAFHDGTPVTSKDVVPSLKRWGVKIIGAQIMMSRIADIAPTSDLSFEIKFKESFGPVIEVLSNIGNPAFIMREKEATTDPNTAITESIGSGPYIFLKEEWVPGNKVVYKKNVKYVPRSEPPDGNAGAKLVKVDRQEWVYMPDPAVATAALANGEVDFWDQPPSDLVPTLEKNPNIKTMVVNRLGSQLVFRPNHLVPPFNNPKVRQVLLYALDQKEFLDAIAGQPDLQKVCWSPYVCGTPLESKAGLGEWSQPGSHREKAKQLLKESGYNGEPVVILDGTDLPVVHAMSIIAESALREVGFKTDLQSMDWSTVVTRRTNREPFSATNRQGWNILFSYASGDFMGNPITNTTAPTPCDGKNWFGWPCDEQLEKIRLEFLTLSSDAERKAWADRFQARFYDVVPYLPVGQYLQKAAMRKNIDGVLNTPRVVYWNIEKK